MVQKRLKNNLMTSWVISAPTIKLAHLGCTYLKYVHILCVIHCKRTAWTSERHKLSSRNQEVTVRGTSSLRCRRQWRVGASASGKQRSTNVPAGVQHVGHEGDWVGAARRVHHVNHDAGEGRGLWDQTVRRGEVGDIGGGRSRSGQGVGRRAWGKG